MSRTEIVLIGPPFAGKSTVGKLLAQQLGLPQASLDDLRWDYFREIGFDEALAKELRQKGGFLSVVNYWCLFNTHAIERALADHKDHIIDCGGGPIVFENTVQRRRIKRAFAPFSHIFRLLPSPNLEESIQVLHERGSHLVGINNQGFDWPSFFVHHVDNRQLATHHIYTNGKTPTDTCAEILALVNQKTEKLADAD